MFTNPFSPIFGGKPDVFFGRKEILTLFEHAMIDAGSDDRAMFITGTRGSGKTALLEQLSIRAGSNKRTVIDLGPENTIEQLIHALAGYDEVTKTVNPQANVNVRHMFAGAHVALMVGEHHDLRAVGRNMREPCVPMRIESHLSLLGTIRFHAPCLHTARAHRIEPNVFAIAVVFRAIV